MKNFKDLLIELNACNEAQKWAVNKTIEEVVKECPRGDWMLWLVKKLDVDIKLLTLTKGYCAKTVERLMRDERSKKAVQAAIDFGEGKITKEELAAACAAAARAKNRLLTADICRKYIGQILIDKVNILLR